MPDVLPAQQPDLEVAEFESELVVFDLRVNQVHVLRDAFAIVFDACDGVTRTSDLVDELTDAGVGSASEAEQLIAGALVELAGIGLLEGTQPATPPPCLGCGGAVNARRRWWSLRR